MGELTASNATCAYSAGTSSPSCDTEPADGAEPLLTRAETAPSAQPYSASTASGDGGDPVREVTDPQVIIPLKRPRYTPTVVEVTCPARQAA
jgi:hypothetical protein